VIELQGLDLPLPQVLIRGDPFQDGLLVAHAAMLGPERKLLAALEDDGAAAGDLLAALGKIAADGDFGSLRQRLLGDADTQQAVRSIALDGPVT